MDIAISATSRWRGTPDVGAVSGSVVTESPDRAFAVQRTKDNGSALIESVTRLKGNPDVESVSVSPLAIATNEEYVAEGHHRTVFRATIDFTVRFTSPEVLASAMEELSRIPGIVLHTTTWELSDAHRDKAEDELLASAVRTAHRRAEIMMRAAGKQTLECISLSDPDLDATIHVSTRSMSDMMLGGVRALSALDVMPSDIDIEVSVTARFRAS